MALFQSRMQKEAFRGKNRFDLSETENRHRTKVWISKGSFRLALMALNLRKLGRYMERKRRKKKKKQVQF